MHLITIEQMTNYIMPLEYLDVSVFTLLLNHRQQFILHWFCFERQLVDNWDIAVLMASQESAFLSYSFLPSYKFIFIIDINICPDSDRTLIVPFPLLIFLYTFYTQKKKNIAGKLRYMRKLCDTGTARVQRISEIEIVNSIKFHWFLWMT